MLTRYRLGCYTGQVSVDTLTSFPNCQPFSLIQHLQENRLLHWPGLCWYAHFIPQLSTLQSYTTPSEKYSYRLGCYTGQVSVDTLTSFPNCQPFSLIQHLQKNTAYTGQVSVDTLTSFPNCQPFSLIQHLQKNTAYTGQVSVDTLTSFPNCQPFSLIQHLQIRVPHWPGLCWYAHFIPQLPTLQSYTTSSEKYKQEQVSNVMNFSNSSPPNVLLTEWLF